MMGHNTLTKVTIVNFPKKMPQANLSKNYAVLYLVIHFNDFFKHYSIMMVHEVDKIHISQFFNKVPFKGKWMICVRFGPKLQHLISLDLPYSKEFFVA